jgi:phospholipid N-methyltransferase
MRSTHAQAGTHPIVETKPAGTDAGAHHGKAHRGDKHDSKHSKHAKSAKPAKPAKPAKAAKVQSAPRRFLAAAIKSPRQVGAIIPSSRFLGRAMMRLADMENARTVIEYGPGTGTITSEIARALHPQARFFAIELNESMAQVFTRNHPNLKLYVRSVADVEQLCSDEKLPPASVDVIISGLPWSVLPEALQTELLEATARVLRPGGVMLTYGYHSGLLLSAGRKFSRALPRFFSKVTRSKPVWLNLPPAFVYRCEK